MTVYVESNFVLELAFVRAEQAECDSLLKMAKAQQIVLTLPAFSLGEPYEALARRAKQRRDLHDKLQTELKELSRSQPYQRTSQELQQSSGFLLQSIGEETRRLGNTLDSMLEVAQIIPIDAQTIRTAISLQQSHELAPQDAIVFASILAHLSSAAPPASCFITKNSRDFVVIPVLADLAKYNCKLLTRFSDGLGYINSQRPSSFV